MRKEWILTDEEKYLKREKIVRNRLIKQQARNLREYPQIDTMPINEVRLVFFSLHRSSHRSLPFRLAIIIVFFST